MVNYLIIPTLLRIIVLIIALKMHHFVRIAKLCYETAIFTHASRDASFTMWQGFWSENLESLFLILILFNYRFFLPRQGQLSKWVSSWELEIIGFLEKLDNPCAWSVCIFSLPCFNASHYIHGSNLKYYLWQVHSALMFPLVLVWGIYVFIRCLHCLLSNRYFVYWLYSAQWLAH